MTCPTLHLPPKVLLIRDAFCNFTKHNALLSINIKTSRACMLSRFSCLTLCNPKDYSPPGSSVHEILQARILEWDAMPSSRGTSQLRDGICISYVFLDRQVGSLPLGSLGKLKNFTLSFSAFGNCKIN